MLLCRGYLSFGFLFCLLAGFCVAFCLVELCSLCWSLVVLSFLGMGCCLFWWLCCFLVVGLLQCGIGVGFAVSMCFFYWV